MATVRWENVRDIVDSVLAIPPSERAVYLNRLAIHPDEKHFVESLLSQYEQARDFLETSALADVSEPLDNDTDPWLGRKIGMYRLTSKLGEGGMGSVYRALRVDDEYQQQVAIKLVRKDFDTRLTVARFRVERQVLATLDHPNIARLLDGGAT